LILLPGLGPDEPGQTDQISSRSFWFFSISSKAALRYRSRRCHELKGPQIDVGDLDRTNAKPQLCAPDILTGLAVNCIAVFSIRNRGTVVAS